MKSSLLGSLIYDISLFHFTFSSSFSHTFTLRFSVTMTLLLAAVSWDFQRQCMLTPTPVLRKKGKNGIFISFSTFPNHLLNYFCDFPTFRLDIALMTTLTKDDVNEPKCDANKRSRKAATGWRRQAKGEKSKFLWEWRGRWWLNVKSERWERWCCTNG